jgi:DNA-binding Xre family transcriptional regulator
MVDSSTNQANVQTTYQAELYCQYKMKIRLREQMAAYRQRTGEALTYAQLAERTGLSRASLESLGTRPSYNATLATIEKICHALECSPGNLLDLDHPADLREAD